MSYLLVNHVPFAIGSTPALVRGVPAMLDDLRAQAAALHEAGMRLMVSAPVVPARHAAAKRCDSEEFAPDDHGFELLHLPVYQSPRAYWRVKSNLAAALRRHIAAADIVQLGYGGHPVMLGEVGWPIAAELGCRRVWMFDAVDPFVQKKSQARRNGNIVKRVLKERLIAHQIRFCRRAIARADAVFAHHPGIADRFASVWGEHCHRFDAPLFGADELPSERSLLGRATQKTDKTRPLRLAGFAPQNASDPADHLIRALAHCRRLSVPVELLLIAPRASAAPMMKLAGELAMDEFVKRHDPPDGPVALMKLLDRCDAMVSIARGGIVEREIFSAMGRGLGVVAYENPATDRLIESADAGIVVAGNNVLLLAQAIIDLHRTRQLLNRFGENAWRAATKRTREFIHRRRAKVIASLVETAAAKTA